ncbi:hypothetical protein ACFV4N_34980 [Actinosynnema sp. NPDC059797]
MVMSVEGEGGVAVLAGGVEVTQARGAPADHVEGVGFPHWSVEGAVQIEGVSGMAQGMSIVSASFPDEREYLVGVCLFGDLTVLNSQVEGLI